MKFINIAAKRHYLTVGLVVLTVLFNRAYAAEPESLFIDISQIKSWNVISDTELLVRTKHQIYRATFAEKCPGLDSAQTVAFITKRNLRLDSSSAVRLPDGLRCHFSNFARVCDKDC